MDTTLSFSLHCHQATLPSGNPALAWMPLIHPLYWWIPPMESPSIIVVEESCAIPWNEDDFHDEISLIPLNARCSSIFRNHIQYEITVLSGKKSTQNPWIHHSHMSYVQSQTQLISIMIPYPPRRRLPKPEPHRLRPPWCGWRGPRPEADWRMGKMGSFVGKNGKTSYSKMGTYWNYNILIHVNRI